MSQPLVYLLLFTALVLPVVVALALRLLGPRLGERGVLLSATLSFGLAIGATLTLSRVDVPLLRIGNLTLLLPSSRGEAFVLPPDIVPLPDPMDATPPVLPTLTPRPSTTTVTSTTAVTSTTTVTSTTNATAATSATATVKTTPNATAAVSATPTAKATPTTPSATATVRRYTVAAGDTIRGLAQRFNVTVEALRQANNLSPAQADALRVGQELIIP